jgi:serine/threonine protein kinase
MFLELAPAGDLFSFLQANDGRLDDLHARVVTGQIVTAVEFLHSKGIVHRDLKMENILVMHIDIGHRVVLTDFGTAKWLKEPRGRMMSLVGTRDYVAP